MLNAAVVNVRSESEREREREGTKKAEERKQKEKKKKIIVNICAIYVPLGSQYIIQQTHGRRSSTHSANIVVSSPRQSRG